jgi:hypothetical protein
MAEAGRQTLADQAGPILRERYFFTSGCQFWMSVMGTAVDSSIVWFIRNRPSRETAY